MVGGFASDIADAGVGVAPDLYARFQVNGVKMLVVRAKVDVAFSVCGACSLFV